MEKFQFSESIGSHIIYYEGFIKCGACIKKCSTHAKYYDDEDYLRHKHELEVDYANRREPVIFI